MVAYADLLARQKASVLTDGPRMLYEMLAIHGVHEAPGSADNPVILGWARELGLGRDYDHDSTPWCGLAMAIVAKRAEKPLPEGPLWALNWRGFGRPVTEPMAGDVMIKTRNGGGHVTLYAAETEDHYVCLGGNQSDSVCYTLIPKQSDAFRWYFRRPIYHVQPAGVQKHVLTRFDGRATRET